MRWSLIIVYLGLAVCFGACGSSGCLENSTTLPLAGLYSSSTLQPISVDSLEIRGLGAPGDSLLLAPTRSTGSVYMPFRADYPSVSWVFAFRTEYLDYPELYDTLTFVYETIPYFASADCGALYIYRVTEYSYTNHLIDSVAVTDSLFTNVDREQIQIYYRTAEDEEE